MEGRQCGGEEKLMKGKEWSRGGEETRRVRALSDGDEMERKKKKRK